MDPLSQGSLGAVFGGAAAAPERLPKALLAGTLAGMVPDLDVLISSAEDPLLFLEFHRQFTHSLAFIPIGAGIVAAVLHPFLRNTFKGRETYLICLLGYATHGLLDACTSYGTQLLWPFSNARFAWNNISIVDPLFTLPLIACAALAAWKRKRLFALAGIVWALAYLLLGVVQGMRAEAAGAALAAARGHAGAAVSAKPGFGTLLVWKTLYEHDGRYYVDAVRAGWRAAVCPGVAVPRLDIQRDLPWLDPDSRQAEDIERFRWFSGGYLALDGSAGNRGAGRVVDMRYSLVPNTAQSLWGIELDPDAPPDAHAAFISERDVDAGQRAAYAALLTGAACHKSAVES